MTTLREAFGAQERQWASAEMDPAARSGVMRTLRARRAWFHTGVASAVVGVAAVGAAAVLLWSGVGEDEPIAPPSPSPTVTVEPSPTPEPSPEPLTMPDFAGGVTEHPYLPSAQEITPEAWNAAGSGWVLATARPEWMEDDYVQGPQVVYLISPDGQRYQIADVTEPRAVYPILWEPGSTTALVSIIGESDTEWVADWAHLDLVSGELALLDASVPNEFQSAPARRTIDGDDIVWDVWFEDGQALRVSLDGTIEVFDYGARWARAVEAAYAAYPFPRSESYCRMIAEFDLNSAAVYCDRILDSESDHFPGHEWEGWDGFWEPEFFQTTLYRAFNDGSGRVEQWGDFDETTLEPGVSAVVVGEVIVMQGGDWHLLGCPTGAYRVERDSWSELPGSRGVDFPEPNIFNPYATSGTSVYTMITSGCSGDVAPEVLVRDDLSTGDFVQLFPYPTNNSDTAWVMTVLLGAYVVP